MKAKTPKKSREELWKIREEFDRSIPKSERNPNAAADFEALLAKAVRTPVSELNKYIKATTKKRKAA